MSPLSVSGKGIWARAHDACNELEIRHPSKKEFFLKKWVTRSGNSSERNGRKKRIAGESCCRRFFEDDMESEMISDPIVLFLYPLALKLPLLNRDSSHSPYYGVVSFMNWKKDSTYHEAKIYFSP